MRWAPYVPVAERRAKAKKKMNTLQKKGSTIQPIEIQGRIIAHTFWGKAWCEHMESFCDADNRLPRGRTYVRNGSVCHLEINEGQINAYVAGSSLYQVAIKIRPIVKEKWSDIKQTCSGRIDSLMDLLSGQLSRGVMDTVCHPNNGLFPLSHDIDMSCTCPDWVTMCKHVAATFYGIGARLDNDPAQLFKLRGVNFEELIDINQAISQATTQGSGQRKRLDNNDLSNLFQLDLSDTSAASASASAAASAAPPEQPKPERIPSPLTGLAIQQKREQRQLTKQAFAALVNVSVASITMWEAKGKQTLNLQEASLRKLKTAWSAE